MEVIGFGIMIFIAFWVIFLVRVSVITRLKLLSYPFFMDVGITVLVVIMYGGTGLGLLAGTMAGILVSISISYYRKRYGYIRNGVYTVGRVNLVPEIKNAIRKRRGAINGRYSRTRTGLNT